MIRAVASLLVATAVTFAVSEARAFNGTIKVKANFYQNQGGFCPWSTRDCTGARYTSDHFQHPVPLPSAKFYVALWSNWNQILGTANTATDGSLTINWFSSTVSNPQVVIYTNLESGTGFYRLASNGPQYPFTHWSGPHSTTNGATQDFGSLTWGWDPASASPFANVFESAFRMYFDVAMTTSRLTNVLPQIVIKAFHPRGSAASACPDGSCAIPNTNTVYLVEGSEYDLNVMHELGHMFSYFPKPFRFAENYCFPTQGLCSGGPWDLTGQAEWGAVTFEEGLCQFFKSVALYESGAPQPHDCDLLTDCPQNLWHLDTFPAGTNCTNMRSRWVLSAATYLRDLFDATNETTSGVVPTCPSCTFTDDSTAPVWMFVDALSRTPSGTGAGQVDEPWNAAYTLVEAQDGRGVITFQSQFAVVSGQTDTNERRMNCNTP